MNRTRDLRTLLDPDPETGRVRLAGQPYLLIRPETLLPLVTCAKPEVVALLVAGGREGGAQAARTVLGAGWEGREAVEKVLASGSVIGWGRFEIAWTDEGAEVRLRHSPFAEAARPTGHPVCHLVRGVLQGVWEEVFGQTAACAEVVCAAQGEAACRFRLVPGGTGS